MLTQALANIIQGLPLGLDGVAWRSMVEQIKQGLRVSLQESSGGSIEGAAMFKLAHLARPSPLKLLGPAGWPGITSLVSTRSEENASD